MKIASFMRDSAATYGVVADGGLVDIGARLGDKYPTLKSVLAAGALDEVRKAADGQAPDVGLDDVTMLPVVPDSQKIICVGLNYATHIKETGRSDSEYPVLFIRYPDAQVGHGQPMVRPNVSGKFDYEGEMAAIIGKAGRNISEADALGHIAGYACFNDGSVRDWQRHTHQFLPGKNFPASGSFGPWMVTADEIPDPSQMLLITRLNGQEMQNSTTDLLIFNVPFLISYISTFTELNPGDVIVTGTPGGVGARRDPPVWMKPGDLIEVDIDKIGVLANPIAAE
jgi:2-keto-4-pentenoate hydratase/2-oxohepta-3-ene-1,7-dioic acid hydratase in catechol pathway